MIIKPSYYEGISDDKFLPSLEGNSSSNYIVYGNTEQLKNK